jgi:uroporphyrinogen-III decarboxylase
MGYELFYQQMMDYEDEVAELIEVMIELELKKLKIAIDCPLELINLCANWSDEIHTPVFRRFFTPYFKKANELVHAAGKLSMVHTDGEMRRMVALFPETNIDVAEAVTPAPQTSLTMTEFRKGYGEKVAIWGGISSIIFEPNYSDQEFDDLVIRLLKETAGWQRFILGMADNLPFDGDINRVGRVVELVEKHGKKAAWV